MQREGGVIDILLKKRTGCWSPGKPAPAGPLQVSCLGFLVLAELLGELVTRSPHQGITFRESDLTQVGQAWAPAFKKDSQ